MLIGLHGAVMIAMNLLAVAFAVACSSRCKTPRWRWLWPLLMAVATLSSVLAAVFGGLFLQQQNIAPRWFFGFFLALFLVSTAGAVMVMRRGLRPAAVPWRRWPLAVLLALVTVLNMLILEQMHLRSMLAMARVRSESAGYLLLQMPAAVPSSDNAFLIYELAMRRMGKAHDLPAWFAGGTEPDAEPDPEALGDLLAGKADVLDLVARASAMPAYRPRLEGLNVYAWPMPDMTGYRNLAILTALAARADALGGDLPAAMARLDQIRRLAGHVSQGPFLIAHALADNIDTIRLRTIEYLMAKTDIPQAMLPAALAPPLVSSLKRFRRALCREGQGLLHGFTLAAETPDIHAVDGGGPMPLGRPNAVTRMWRAYFLPDDLKAARDIITRQMCLPADSFAALEANLAAIGKAREDGRMGILSSIAAPDFTDSLTLAMRYDTLVKLGAAALAAIAFRETRGDWPTDAAALAPDFMPAVPIDPFDGKPIKLMTAGGGIELYSFGPPPTNGSMEPIRFCLGGAARARYGIQPIRRQTP